MKNLLLLGLTALMASRLLAQEPPPADESVRFRAVDVYLDAKDKPLAAYQLELVALEGTVRIVGIEGGEHPAFQTPPFYDPKAIQHERVILAAFNTAAADKLPKGKTRVATVHFQTTRDEVTRFTVKLQTAASVDGKRISAAVTIEERKNE